MINCVSPIDDPKFSLIVLLNEVAKVLVEDDCRSSRGWIELPMKVLFGTVEAVGPFE